MTGSGGTGMFAGLITEVLDGAGRFGPRQHVHFTWLSVRRYGVGAATAIVADSIQCTARYAGAPQKCNVAGPELGVKRFLAAIGILHEHAQKLATLFDDPCGLRRL